MKSLKLILIICLLTTMSCTHKVVKKESINRICYIDSVKMNDITEENYIDVYSSTSFLQELLFT